MIWHGAFGESRSAREATAVLLEADLPSQFNLVLLWSDGLFGATVAFHVEAMLSLGSSAGGGIRASGLKQSFFSPPSDKVEVVRLSRLYYFMLSFASSRFCCNASSGMQLLSGSRHTHILATCILSKGFQRTA